MKIGAETPGIDVVSCVFNELSSRLFVPVLGSVEVELLKWL